MSKPEPVKIHFIPADTAKAGKIVEAKLDLEIGADWHLFSDKPEIPGILATQVLLENSSVFTVDRIVYPKATPEYNDVFKKDLNFYHDQVSILIYLKLQTTASGDIPIAGTLKYQACSNSLCLPPGKLNFNGVQRVQP